MLSQDGSGQPGDGGPITSQFQVVSQEPDILVQVGNKVIPAETIYARELTFGIEYQFTIPLTEYMGEGPQAAAGLRAEWLQTLGNHEHVVGLYVTQDVNAQNLLRDFVFITVGTDDLQNTTQIRVLLDNANNPGTFQAIDNAWSRVSGALTAG